MKQSLPDIESNNGHLVVWRLTYYNPTKSTFRVWCETCKEDVQPDELDKHGIASQYADALTAAW